MLDFITYELCYRSLPDNAKLLIRRASLIDLPFLKDAFNFLAPELSREIKALIPGLLKVSLLQQLTDPRYGSTADGSAIMYAVHPIVAAPLQQLLTEDERRTALCQAGSYFERQGFEISDNPLDLEAACDYYWKAGQAELAEQLLFRYLQHFWDRSGQYGKMIQFAERAKKLSDSIGGKATADSMKASALMNQGNYDAALRLFDDTLKLEKDIGDRAGMASTLNQIASIYFDLEKFEISVQFVFASYIILNQIKGANLRQAEKNFNAAVSQLPEEVVKKTIEQTQRNLEAGRLLEIVPLS